MNDRQHELEKNLLAEKLAHINTAIEPYSKIIAVVVGLVIVGGIVLGLRNMNASENRSESTFQLLMNQPDVGEKFPGTTAAAWSMLNQGNEYMAQGVSAMYSDRDEAVTLLDQAKTSFNEALKSKPDLTLLVSRSHLGLAMVAESLGDVDEAIAQYKLLMAEEESKAMVANAEKRIAALENPDTQQFLTWFADQDFSPADPELPPALPDSSGLPDVPDMKFSPLGFGSDSDSDQEPKAIEGGMELPADEAGDATTTEAEADAGEPEAKKPEKDAEVAEPEATEKSAPSEKDAEKANEKPTEDAVENEVKLEEPVVETAEAEPTEADSKE